MDSTVNLIAFTVQVIDEMPEAFIRPMEINVAQADLDEIADRASSSSLGAITDAGASKLVENTKLGAPEAQVVLPYGNKTKRGRWTCEIGVEYPRLGRSKRLVLSGITNYIEMVEHNGQQLLDPEMEFIINSQMISNGPVVNNRLDVVADLNSFDENGYDDSKLLIMDPSLVIASQAMSSWVDELQFPSTGYTDTSLEADTYGMGVNDRYNLIGGYLGAIIRSAQNQIVTTSSSAFYSDETAMATEIASDIKSDQIINSPFMTNLMEANPDGRMIKGSSFTIDEIVRLFPYFYEKTTVLTNPGILIPGENMGIVNQDLADTQQLVFAILAVMSNYGLSSVEFRAEYRGFNEPIAIQLTNEMGVIGIPYDNLANDVTISLRQEALNPLTLNGFRPFILTANANAFSDIIITLDLGSGPVTTSHAGSISSQYMPVVTKDQQASEMLSSSVSAIINTFAEGAT